MSLKLLTAKLKVVNVGALIVQGCRKEVKKQYAHRNTLKYNLQILGLTETRIPQEIISTVAVIINQKDKNIRHITEGWKGQILM